MSDRAPETKPTPSPSPPAAKPRRRRRPRTKKKPAPTQVTANDSLEAILLQTVREAYQDLFGQNLDETPMDLNLRFQVTPGKPWRLTFDPPLPEQLREVFERHEARDACFHQGRVYCFQCDQPDCEHSTPASAQEVFAGYDPVGRPRWQEMAPYLLELKDERVDQLYRENGQVVSRQLAGHNLKHRQLTTFGKASKRFSLISQVILGYLPLKDRDGARERLAISFQAVESRTAQGRIRLHLNTVMYGADRDELETQLDEQFPWIRRARRQAEEKLQRAEEHLARLVQRPNGVKPRQVLRQVPDILQQMRQQLQQGYRQSCRRTKHAEERRELLRPIDKAMADLQTARLEDFFFDNREETVILRGQRGRCHVFTTAGKHVTSFVIGDTSTQGRLRRGRWTPLDQSECESFLAGVAGAGRPG